MSLVSGKENAPHVLVYAHYSRQGEVPGYLRACLQRALEVVDEVVLVAAGQPVEALPRELRERVELVCRENRGWDFASYRDGLAVARQHAPGRITLCNDSVYGPLFPLQEAFSTMAGKAVDAWGMTASNELWWHLQSYFLSFSPAVIGAGAFWDFWEAVPDDAVRREVIRNGEIGLSRVLLDAGFVLDAYCPTPKGGADMSGPDKVRRGLAAILGRWNDADLYRDVADVVFHGARLGVNPSLAHWSTLIREQRLPFVKRAAVAQSGGLDMLLRSMDGQSPGICDEVLDAIKEDLQRGA